MKKNQIHNNLVEKKPSRPFVSVVIPVYNVAKYLPKCIESVINQTLENIEIIIVNDGSTDDSLRIMKSYAEGDHRVKIIDKPNSGYGNSMNQGIASATGKYIGIVESDDYIAKEMYEELYALTDNGNVDVVKGNFFDLYDDGIKPPYAEPNHERDMIPDSTEPFTLRKAAQISWGHPSVWSAIYRRQFLIDNNIVFIEEKGGGWVDNPFFYETLCKAQSIMWTKKPYYYYLRSNPNSSSNKQGNPHLPFARMMDNLDVLDREHYTDAPNLRCAYARALMYLNGAVEDFDYDANEQLIVNDAKALLSRLNYDIITQDFNLRDQLMYYTYMSPFKKLSSEAPKILIYNWLPFDNQWNWGGGVTIYCKNLIEEILKSNPDVNIYFISSGFAYDATSMKTYTRKIKNIFGDRVHQYEIVNSPVPAEQANVFINPNIAIENSSLKDVFDEFINTYGPFKAIHFNNIEGLSFDVLDLKKKYNNTKFIFSIHNYVPICVTGFYYMRHKHCNCNPAHTGEDCMKCSRVEMRDHIANEMYNRGTFGKDSSKCYSKKRWINNFGFEYLDESADADNILNFAKNATKKINENCDHILAVSKRVYDIAAENGFDESKMQVSYIGTKIAEHQLGHAACKPENGLKIVFLGNDINYEEKGYPFLLDALSEMDPKSAAQIDLVLTVRQAEHAEIYTMLRNFRSIKVIQGYTHDDLPSIFKGCNLSIVPVLWEDNLPQIAIESVAYGVPVLSSSAGGASELCDSNLFRFEAGNGDELCDKIKHFLENPNDLEEYWKNHHGLVTMKQHWNEISSLYLPGYENEKIEIPISDYCDLVREHDFLLKNISLNDAKLTSRPELENLKQKLRESNELNEKLKMKVKAMEHKSGKVIFQSDYDPVQGHVGVNLFRLTVPDWNYSDFIAEIRFIKLENIGASILDTLMISGTLIEQNGERSLHLHQMDWRFNKLNDWIYVSIENNSITFFGRYPGKACGYSYEICALTSRAADDKIEYQALNNGFVFENERRAENAKNCLSDASVTE